MNDVWYIYCNWMSPLQCDAIWNNIMISFIEKKQFDQNKTHPDSFGPQKRYELSRLRILTRISDKCDIVSKRHNKYPTWNRI